MQTHNPWPHDSTPPNVQPPAYGMPPQAPMMPPMQEQPIRYIEAFKFIFTSQDPWSNILIAFVFMLIPIAGQLALLGWHAEIMQRLAQRHPNPIPKLQFGDLSHYLPRGVAPFIAQLIASFPFSIMGAIFGGILSVSVNLASRESSFFSIIIISIFGLLMLASTPALMLLIGSLMTRAELTEDVNQTINFEQIKSFIKLTWRTSLVAYLLYTLLCMAAGFAGILVFCVGVYAVSVIAQIGLVHLRWQMYEIYLARGGQPIPIKVQTVPIPSEMHRK